MARRYIFESSKPERVRKAEAAAKHASRQAAGRKAAETRRAKQGKQPLPRNMSGAAQIKAQIKYLNQRLAKYGDPDHLLDLLPPVARTDTGKLSASAESVSFFAGGQAGDLLDQIKASIRKHPVSNPMREMLEETLGEIYDELKNIGQDRFYEMLGKDLGQQFVSKLKTDADTNRKVEELVQTWQQARSHIPAYYEEQIRGGKLAPFTD